MNQNKQESGGREKKGGEEKKRIAAAKSSGSFCRSENSLLECSAVLVCFDEFVG